MAEFLQLKGTSGLPSALPSSGVAGVYTTASLGTEANFPPPPLPSFLSPGETCPGASPFLGGEVGRRVWKKNQAPGEEGIGLAPLLFTSHSLK